MSSNHPRDSSARHSPIASLASLEYLQNQRRGSITDPSLHAAHIPSGIKLNPTYRLDQLPAASSGPSSETSSKPHLPDPRPSSPYVFGDATPHSEHSSQLRKLLHSPSTEHTPLRGNSSLSHDSQDPPRSHAGLNISKEPNQMNVDNDRHVFLGRRGIRDPPSFDFNMRRHSIAVGQNPITLPHLSSTLGTKRKMSGDRSIFAPVGEDVDPQLTGPGVPSGMDVDADAPAPKRRGSTIDMQRIAQLSLNDRRNSVDSRGNQWLNDRRESAPSLYPNVPGISSFNTGFNPSESQHVRAPPSLAAFSWPPNSDSSASATSTVQSESSHSSRQFDPMNQMNLVPPISYPPDRRMSVPDALAHPTSSRTLRSRSRPPSRQNTDPNTQSGPSSGQDEPPSTSAPHHNTKLTKEVGSTPYSRSPELRVSHKLAERKRRKEMKDLFDELRDQLPADRGMKASKWEILSKAIDFVAQLKRSHQEMAQELEMLRQQVHGQRTEPVPVYAPGGPQPPHSTYSQSSSIGGSFPPPLIQPLQAPPPAQTQGNLADSRSNSSQSLFPTPVNSSSQNANGHRQESSSN